jgi:NitT/TauT family transport system substrate-binding protein
MTTINIRVLRHSAFYTPLLLTIKAGFLAQQGLQAHYDIATAENPVEAGLLSGEIHLAQSAVATSFALRERGEDNGLRHFAQINERDGFFLVQRDTGASFDWHDLIGQQVLVDHFFQPLAMFRYALHILEIDYKALDAIDAGDVESMDRAYRSGNGQFVHQQGPYAQQLEADGLGKVVAAVGDVIGPVAFSSLLASQDWLTTDMASAFIAAYRKGQQAAIAMSAEEIATLLADFFPKIDQAVLAATIASYQQLGCWTKEPGIARASFERALDVFEFSGLISRRFAYEEIISLPPKSTV